MPPRNPLDTHDDPVLQEVEDEAIAELNASLNTWDEHDPRAWEVASGLLLIGGSGALIAGWFLMIPWLGFAAIGGGFLALMTSGQLFLGVLIQLLFGQRTLLQGLRGGLISGTSVILGPVLMLLGLLLIADG